MSLACILFVVFSGPQSQPPSAEDLLAQSIAFHDPEGAWASFAETLTLRETRPNGPDRDLQVTLDLPGQAFVYEMKQPGVHLLKSVTKGECQVSLNGSSTLSEAELKKYRASCQEIQWYQNYYLYLYGLPMKLKDPGTMMDPNVTATEFMEKPVWAIRVTYAAEVGSDIWYFYFDKATAQLVGCRFYHDESANDGEYIIFEDVYALGKMKLPKNRTWYTNKAGRLLGSDHLEGHLP